MYKPIINIREIMQNNEQTIGIYIEPLFPFSGDKNVLHDDDYLYNLQLYQCGYNDFR